MKALLIALLLASTLVPAQELSSVYESEVSGNTYRSRFFGFQMNFPEGWQAQHAGEYGPVSSFGRPVIAGWGLLLQARPAGTSRDDSREISIGVTPAAERGTQNLEDILRDLLKELPGLQAPRLVEINSRTFARAGSHGSRSLVAGDQTVELEEHTAVLVTAAHDHYVAFIFRARSQEELSPLLEHAEGISGWSANKPRLRPQPKAEAEGEIVVGRALSQPRPKYPREAKEKGITGTVLLRVLIATTGRIKHLEVISGPVELQKAAMDAVRKWRHEPYRFNGKPVEVETQVTVNFTLTK